MLQKYGPQLAIDPLFYSVAPGKYRYLWRTRCASARLQLFICLLADSCGNEICPEWQGAWQPNNDGSLLPLVSRFRFCLSPCNIITTPSVASLTNGISFLVSWLLNQSFTMKVMNKSFCIQFRLLADYRKLSIDCSNSILSLINTSQNTMKITLSWWL